MFNHELRLVCKLTESQSNQVLSFFPNQIRLSEVTPTGTVAFRAHYIHSRFLGLAIVRNLYSENNFSKFHNVEQSESRFIFTTYLLCSQN